MNSGSRQYGIVRRSHCVTAVARNLKRLGLGLFFVFICLCFCLYTRAGGGARVAYAATSSQLSFQARLMSSGGAVVPDGTYSIQFKLYNAASGGVAEWTETDGSVTVRGGYFSVYLGAGSAFPSTIDWSSDQWITMNVNADGEMNPRIQLASVPYAFRAGQADSLTNGSSSLTASNLAQLAPSSAQAVNSALTLLQLNQTGTGALAQLQHGGVDAFTLAASGDLMTTGNGSFKGGTVTAGTATVPGALVLNDGAGKTGSLQLAALGLNRTYTLPDATGTVCLTTTCAGAANGFIQNGNSFGGLAVLGTNDAYGLALRTNGINRLTLDTSGNANLTGAFTAGTGLTVSAGGEAITGNSTINGTLTGLTGLTVASGGATINGGLNNAGGGITSAGSITGVGSNITGSGAVALASGASGNLTLNAASGTAVLGATTLQTVDNLGLDLSKATDTTLSLVNSGAGIANLNLSDGSLQTAATTRLTNGGALQNVTGDNANGVSFNTNTLTAGVLGVARGGTGAATFTGNGILFGNGSSALQVTGAGTGGQLLVAGATGTPGFVSLGGDATLAADGTLTIGSSKVTNAKLLNSSLTITAGTGLGGGGAVSLGGSTTLNLANTAVTIGSYGDSGHVSTFTVDQQGRLTAAGTTTLANSGLQNSSVNLAYGTNLSGDSSVALGGTLHVNFSATPTFTSVTTNTVSSATASDLSLSAATGLINLAANTTLKTTSGLTIDLNNAANQTLSLVNNGVGVANLSLDGALTAATGLTVSSGGASISGAISGATTANTINGLVINSGALSNITTIAASGAITAATSGNTINGLVINSGALSGVTTINASGLATTVGLNVGTGQISGTGGLSVSGSSSINSDTITSTQFTFGGANGTLTTSSNGDLTLVPNGTGKLVLNTGSGGLLTTNASTIQRTAAGTTTIDLNDASATTLNLTNSGTGVANLNLVKGGLSVAGTQVLTNGGALQNLTGLTVTSGGGSISGGFTATGAVNINSNFNATTSINTGTSTGTIMIGGGSAGLVIDSTNFDVSSAGGLSGITGYIQASGNFAISGSGTFATGSGAVGLNGATTIATSTASASALTVNGTTGTAASALAVNQTGDAADLTLTNTARTSGALVSLTQSTSAFTGTGLLVNLASGSGSFASGSFLDFQVNGTSKFTVNNAGGLTISTNNSSALVVKSSSAVNYLSIDTSGSGNVQIGSTTTDATAILLVLDSYNGASDPTGVAGGEYYSTNSSARRCYENGYWSDCATTRVQADSTLAAAAASISVSLAGTPTALTCHLESPGRSVAGGIYLRANNVSAASSYGYNVMQNLTGATNNTTEVSSTAATEVRLTGSGTGSGSATFTVGISNFLAANKPFNWTGAGADVAGNSTNVYTGSGAFYNTTNAVTSIQFLTSTGNFNTGTRAWCDGR